MNICLVSTGFPPENGGGICTYIYNLSHGLSALGHHVQVVTKTSQTEYLCETMDNNITVHRLPEKELLRGIDRFAPGLNWSYQLFKFIKKLDQQSKIDIIEFPNWESPGFVSQFFLSRIPMVVRIHTPLFETLELDKANEKIKLDERMACFLEKVSCKKALQLVSSTIFHSKMIAEKYKIDVKNIKILPLGVIDSVEHKKITHSDNKRFNILYVSRLENRKGTLTLLDSLPELLKGRKNIYIDFVGSDRPHAPGKMTHQEYFNKHYAEFTDNVTFHGFVTNKELHSFYQNADLFIVPSVYESFGLIYIEAMLYGLPSIATTGGGIPEVVTHGENGYLIEPYNTSELIHFFNKIYEDSNLRKILSINARKAYETKFSYLKMSENTESVYRKMIKKCNA